MSDTEISSFVVYRYQVSSPRHSRGELLNETVTQFIRYCLDKRPYEYFEWKRMYPSISLLLIYNSQDQHRVAEGIECVALADGFLIKGNEVAFGTLVGEKRIDEEHERALG